MRLKILLFAFIFALLWMPIPVRAQSEPPAQCVAGVDAFYAGDADALALLE